jgi:hypothetical protein
VRFRVTGFSSWSAWKKSDVVRPRQTVVDSFFPLFDLEKMAKLNNPLTTSIEVEYEYRDADGEKIEESDTRRVRLLGRNQIFFSSLDKNVQVGWFDKFNNAPLIMGSFVSSNDPVVQQLAGIVSGKTGGIAANRSLQEAKMYMKTLFNYLSDNKIAYQTPPGGKFEGQFGQHIKFGRDVLRNRAGTCVDLAVLFASACDAVGLDPVIYVVPRHAFPAVRIGGYIIPVEATKIGHASFEEALEAGNANLAKLANTEIGYKVDIRQLHDMGVDSLDLPTVPADYLAQLGYDFDAQAARRYLTLNRRSRSGDTAAVETQPESDVTVEPRPKPEPRFRYAIVRITNTLKNRKLRYEICNGDDEWDEYEVDPGAEYWNWYVLPRDSDKVISKVLIRFDCDVSERACWKKYTLKTTLIETDPTDLESLESFGVEEYRFSFANSSKESIDLFHAK